MKIFGILHDFRIFFIGKGSSYQTLRKARQILELGSSPGHNIVIVTFLGR